MASRGRGKQRTTQRKREREMVAMTKTPCYGAPPPTPHLTVDKHVNKKDSRRPKRKAEALGSKTTAAPPEGNEMVWKYTCNQGGATLGSQSKTPLRDF